jgi:4-hydroxy-tetrahydrodipicolinate synthase
MGEKLELEGVIPAIALPLNSDCSIDEEGLRRHVRRIVDVSGVTGIVCNAIVSEVIFLNREERKRVLEIVCKEVNGKVPVISGVYSESIDMAKEFARDAKNGGADAILIMPPFHFSWGATKYPEFIFDYFSTIDKVANTPFIVFQYAHWTGSCYDCQTLLKLSKIENFIAIKNAINDPRRYEQEYRCLKTARPQISFLNANDIQMFSYFCLGSDGALVGYASFAPEFVVSLYAAIKNCDLQKAREINNRMYPLTQAFYSNPKLNRPGRIKEALVMMGEIKSATSRAALPVSDEERESIRNALYECGIPMKFV